jgi:hypothetical protein
MDSLQRDFRVTLAGPTTLLALLNSLHMGFRTLALEKQASEVWKVLGAVKTEFERYGEWVAKVREQVQKAADTLDKADTRSKQMRRALKVVEALPETEALARLPLQMDDLADVIDPNDRFIPSQSQGLGRREPDDQRTGQPRIGGYGDRGQILRCFAGLTHRRIDHRQDPFKVSSGSDFRDHPSELLMQGFLSRHAFGKNTA